MSSSSPILLFFLVQVPWEALRALLGQSVYGGRVDSVFDQELLESFVSSLFQPKSFDLDFPLCRCESSYRAIQGEKKTKNPREGWGCQWNR